MCEVVVQDEVVIFTAPEFELLMGYITTRPIVEKIEIVDGVLKISPPHVEIVHTLESICKSDVSSLLLDIKLSLLHLGWLVDGDKDIVKIRKSRLKGVGGFVTIEYDKIERKMTIVTTEICLYNILQAQGFKIYKSKYFIEAVKYVPTLIEALEIEETLSQTVCG
ncbi:MAG: hypothetical protein QXS16_00865 [Pyrobaculum sp.]